MDFVTILGYVMIVVFVIAIMKRKLSPFVALLVVPIIFGMIYAVAKGMSVLEVFQWVYDGVFYSVNDAGKVKPGTMRSGIMIFFAVSYFTLMMHVGLFDPLIIFIIKMVKGDPLKIMVASTIAAGAVSLDGDGTSTVLITTAAFMPLYKQFKIKGIYLALLIALPTSVFNMTPWGGPLARVLSALNLDVTDIFPKLLPGMAVVLIYAIIVAYFLGKKERTRLGYDPKTAASISDEEMEKMFEIVRDQDPEFKQPKKVWFNFIMTAVILFLLIFGHANSGVLFALGLGLGLVVNYGFDFQLQRQRLSAAVEEAAPTTSIILASGALMGVIQGSGMGTGIANNLASFIPAGAEHLIPLITAVVGIPGLIFLSSDGFYFGILPVLASVANNFGISMEAMGIAAMIPLATYYATPLIAWIWILIDRTECEFADYQKIILKFGIPAFVLYVITFAAIGYIPLLG